MAAPAYQSIGTDTFAIQATLNIPKPSGLQVGDLMLYCAFQPETNNFPAKSGWRSLDGVLDAITVDGSVNQRRVGFQYRIADAADVAASEFVFTPAGGLGTSNSTGSILRITGHDPNTPIGAWNQAKVDNSTTPSFANGITPPRPDCLLIMVGGCAAGNFGGGGPSISNYAIATDNPTWSERLDISINAGSEDPTAFAATAPRAAVTPTGNSSLSIAQSATVDSICYLIAIQPPPTGPANVKTVNGLAVASIATANGLGWSSVKSFNGLT